MLISNEYSLEFNTGLLDVTTHTDRLRNNSMWSEGGGELEYTVLYLTEN